MKPFPECFLDNFIEPRTAEIYIKLMATEPFQESINELVETEAALLEFLKNDAALFTMYKETRERFEKGLQLMLYRGGLLDGVAMAQDLNIK